MSVAVFGPSINEYNFDFCRSRITSTGYIVISSSVNPCSSARSSSQLKVRNEDHRTIMPIPWTMSRAKTFHVSSGSSTIRMSSASCLLTAQTSDDYKQEVLALRRASRDMAEYPTPRQSVGFRQRQGTHRARTREDGDRSR